jgi:hypothetical protein
LSGDRSSEGTDLYSGGQLLDRARKTRAAATTGLVRLAARDQNGFREKNVLRESAVNSGNGESVVSLLHPFRKSI